MDRAAAISSGVYGGSVSRSSSALAGSPTSAAGRHVLRSSPNPATETLYADITQRLAA